MECLETSIDNDPTENCGNNTLHHDIGIGIPCEGSEFRSDNDAYQFYNTYAKSKGFSVRRHFVRRSRRTNSIVARTFCCHKEGFRYEKKQSSSEQIKLRRITREGCNAHIYVCMTAEGSWVVKRFVDQDNHHLANISELNHLLSHRKIHDATKELIGCMRTCGLGPSKIAAICRETGEQCVTTQVCKDILKVARKSNIGNECTMIVHTFLSKLSSDHGFYFKLQVDNDATVQSIFWADSRSRNNYLRFGDVLIFDTTYRTNKFSMPFAPFTGINHHRQSTLFGCALLADETTETFVWLFQTWLSCMHGIAPKAIITDQDPSMREAISIVFPTTVHRFCSWHIRKNATMHLQKLRFGKDSETDYNDLIYKSNTTGDFETKWVFFSEKYNISNDNWLFKMYELRQHWVPVFLNNTFFAGMTSSQRSESINAFFDGYVTSQTPLSEFVHQYDRALSACREAEESEDFKALYSKPTLLTRHPVETQASLFYTPANFILFQQEFKLIADCENRKKCKEDEVTTYEVYMHAKDSNAYVVMFERGDECISCSCKKFEREGILCCHILSIFRKKGIIKIPSRYLLERWGIGARFVNTYCSSSTIDVDKPTAHMLCGFSSLLNDFYDWGSLSTRNFGLAMEMINEIMLKIKNQMESDVFGFACNRNSSEQILPLPSDCTHSEITQRSFIDVQDPKRVRSKGRPKNVKRIKSSNEKILGEPKKRRCHFCWEEGHYQSTCKLKAKPTDS